jgi:hypothetical protein
LIGKYTSSTQIYRSFANQNITIKFKIQIKEVWIGSLSVSEHISRYAEYSMGSPNLELTYSIWGSSLSRASKSSLASTTRATGCFLWYSRIYTYHKTINAFTHTHSGFKQINENLASQHPIIYPKTQHCWWSKVPIDASALETKIIIRIMTIEKRRVKPLWVYHRRHWKH